MPTFRAIVCGSRETQAEDFARVSEVLDSLLAWCQAQGLTLLIREGACFTGIDYAARRWVHARGVAHESYRAAWDTYGNRAGPLRNLSMARAGAEICIAFPGGTGTADMCRAAAEHKIRVVHV